MVNLEYYGNSSYTSFHTTILYYNQVARSPFQKKAYLRNLRLLCVKGLPPPEPPTSGTYGKGIDLPYQTAHTKLKDGDLPSQCENHIPK